MVNAGLTIKVFPTVPVLQAIDDEQFVAVIVTLSPAHALVFVAVRLGNCPVPIVMVFVDLPTHPSNVHVNVYTVSVVGFKIIEAAVEPVLQAIVPLQSEAVKVTFPPAQTDSDEAVIFGI